MTFFNKKEDVIHIELTPHGRKLLSEGKLKPYGYSFFDDDILYNSNKAGTTEDNSATKTRILVDTPSMKPQACYKGVETELNNQLTNENDNLLLHPIGTSKPSHLNVNTWDATMVRGEISASAGYMSSSSPIVHIPQLECEVNYEMRIRNVFSEAPDDSLDTITSDVSEEGNFLSVIEKQLLVHLVENGGFSNNDSLNMEVFIYDYDNINMKKLHFEKQSKKIVNDMYIPDDVASSIYDHDHDDDINSTMVENYFYVYFDNEIDEYDICRGVSKLKDNKIFIGRELVCDDIEFDENINIYMTNVDDIEDCEQ